MPSQEPQPTILSLLKRANRATKQSILLSQEAKWCVDEIAIMLGYMSPIPDGETTGQLDAIIPPPYPELSPEVRDNL